jgi:guanosine-3',5'-bis(diphosphate) 3'-pyrophosphohydrolase
MTEMADNTGIAGILKKLSDRGQSGGEMNPVAQAFRLLSDQCEKDGNHNELTRALDVAAIIVDEVHLGGKAVTSCLLISLYERNLLSDEQIVTGFGTPVLEVLKGLRKIENLESKQFKTNAENFIRLLLTLSDDISVILIRLAQRVYDMRNISDLPGKAQGTLAEEISLLYIPIAHRIGLYRIKTEFEDRVLLFREPGVFEGIEQKLREISRELEIYASGFIIPIQQRLEENGFDAEIKSRLKSISSIWRKMQKQQVEFDKVYDLFAIRVIISNTVESEQSDCWKVYSLVTDIYTPNPKRLRDWTSFPKPNGYESLHATVVGPSGRWVEIQIRTKRMDEIAEKGYAAHWKYKAGEKPDARSTMFAVMRELLEKPGNLSNEVVVSADKKALYSDEIFIFTPKGDLKKLKAGYSVLDFAWEIHTKIGSTCTGAVVNGKMVPLKHILQNGDTVKILTSRTQKPNPGWLDIVRSPRTIARIKHALKMETYRDSEVGKEIIKHKLNALGKELTDPVINLLIDAFGCEHVLDLYQKFGEGKIDPLKIKKVLNSPGPAPTVHRTIETGFPERISEVLTGREDFVIIDPSIRSIHYQFAKCCNPVPDHPIFAFVSVSQGIKIHNTKCHNAYQLVTRYPYRILEARWKEPLKKEEKK